MPISKNFEFLNLFNYQIMKIKESGILNYIEKSYYSKFGGIKRLCESSVRQKGTPIDIYTVISAVMIYISGLSICIFGVILENVWKLFYKRKNNDFKTEFQTAPQQYKC